MSNRISPNQRSYLEFIARADDTGREVCIADVDRACRRNPNAGHKWVYDGVGRLVRRGFVHVEQRGPRKILSVSTYGAAVLAGAS